MNDDLRNWRNAILLLALVMLASIVLQITGLQLTQVFLFFSVYLPLILAASIYVVKKFQRRRREY